MIAENASGDCETTEPNIVFCKDTDSVNIHFENVTCTVPSTPYRFWRKEKKEILKNVNGDFLSNKLTAIIGPSGGGKTTLMDIISGYRLNGVSGYVYVNGKEGNRKTLMNQSCYIMQHEKLQPLVTVQEAMEFVANVKLETTVSKKCKENIVSEILDNFSLLEHKNSLTKDLSGGEKKRLAIALELINNPSVLILDEPTSGLDSKSAKQCLTILQRLAREGRTVICSIHQPSALLLNLFDNVYVLSNGTCIYQGTVNNIIPYLSLNHFSCPMYHNPAEYVIEICALGTENDVNTLVQTINNGRSQEWLDSALCWSNIPLNFSTTNIKDLQWNDIENNFKYATSFQNQIYYLLYRTLLITTRDQFLTRMKILTNIIVAVILGISFYGIGNDAAQIFVNFNLIFFCVMFIMFNAITSKIISFPDQLPVVKREYFNRWYSLKAYFISTTLGDLPVQAFCVLLFSSIVYYLSGQPLEWYRIIQFTVILILLALLFQDYGILVGTLANVENGLIFGLFTISPWVMFSGFFLYYRDTTIFFQWIFKISVLRRALEAVTVSVYGYNRKVMQCSKNFCQFKFPDLFLKQTDMDSTNYGVNFAFILTVYVIVKIGCYAALKYKLTRER